MRAVLMERGRLWVGDVPAPQPAAGEVLVKSIACGICGSDLHAARHTEDFVAASREAGGAFKLTTFNPVVMGHEFCAEIVDFGPGCERRFAPGQLVCSVPALTGTRNDVLGYSDQVPGGFAQYMVLSEQMLRAVPAGTPATAAALTEPMAVGYHAVNKAALRGDETVLVLGAGPVGLAVITALRSANVHSIIAADYSPGRRRYAAAQGAHEVIDPGQDDPFQHVAGQQRPVVVFECVGVPGMLDNICMKAPEHTRIVVVGVCLQPDTFRPLPAINKELSMQFVLGYSMQEFDASLTRIADGRFDVADLVSHRIALDEVSDTFEALRNPDEHAKVVVEPWQNT